MRDQNYIKAKDIFTEVINLDQSWAEAWNKRATVLYMLGEFQKSQNDIDQVLALEQRHFGALAGQGLVNIQLKNYEKAIRSYEQAQEIYHASEVVADTKIRDQLKDFESKGYGNLPICIAKTQYSFSTDPSLKGAPSGHVVPIREVRLSSGAEFIVVVCGAIMTMPGLPRVPAADSIKLNDKGEIEGLF